MQIPIENIYYLLCYSWNKLQEKERVNVSIDDKTQLLDLFAMILINATKILLKRGIDKSYTEHLEEVVGVKGKIQFGDTLKRNLLFKQKTICSFDQLSANTLSNRILLTSLTNLAKTKALDKSLKAEIVSLQRMFNDIDPIALNPSIFIQVKVNRNNRIYGFIMNVCQIVYENTLPSEEAGKFKFSDFTRDEKKMNQLFESFVRNFYRIEQRKFRTVKKETIHWQLEASDTTQSFFIPRMETDITLENESEKIIIDAKYYRETMVTNYNKEKIRSNNLYQLFSYLINQEDGSQKTVTTKGILLYPTVENEYDLKLKHKQHPIEIRTINLNLGWRLIDKRLREIVEV